MERPVVVGWVVAVISVLDHLIDEPAVNSFVEMGRLNPEQEKAQDGRQGHDQPGGPVGSGQARFPVFPLIPERRKFR